MQLIEIVAKGGKYHATFGEVVKVFPYEASRSRSENYRFIVEAMWKWWCEGLSNTPKGFWYYAGKGNTVKNNAHVWVFLSDKVWTTAMSYTTSLADPDIIRV